MLWGAFNNASTAMQVFTTDLGSISQNIANVNTTGYKKQEMMFSTMMSEHHAAPATSVNGLNIFGVQATQRNLIDAQGVITPSTTWSDLAINGQGFFMLGMPKQGAAATTVAGAGAGTTNVPTTASLDDPAAVMYTRSGAWHRAYGADSDPNLARSYFLSDTGGYLLGWMADEAGNIPNNATLEPVYTLAPRPISNNGTPAVDQTSTINPSAVSMPGRATTTATVLANLPSNSTVGGNQTSQTVTDAGGVQRDMTLNWTRTSANTYTVTASVPSGTLATDTWTVTTDANGKVISPATDPAVDVVWTSPAGTTTPTISLAPPKHGAVQKIPVQVFDNNFNEHTAMLQFERSGADSWYLTVDPGSGATSASPPVQVTFDSNGKLLTPAGGALNLALSWTSGTPPVTSNSTVSLNLGNVTQYKDDALYVRQVNQDGYGRGTLMSTAFNDRGELRGYYDNGRSRTLFKVPVANFVSDNALEPVSGTMFRRTTGAGDVTVTAIEKSPGASAYATSSLENSTVDIEGEFTRMIMTQKAYSTNAQVFKTADEMTTTARDLKA
jgi:flagellar hook protein FlgE